MSRPQLPGWVKLLERMLDWAAKESIIRDDADVRELITGTDKVDNDLLLAAQELRRRLGERNFGQFLRGLFRDKTLQPSEAHRLLPQLNFAAVLTTNYDKLIESAYPAATPAYTQLSLPELPAVSRDRDFAVVKVHGDIDWLDSIVLGQADYRKAMFASAAFRVFLINTFTTRTVLFLGCSLTDPDLLAFLDELVFQCNGQLGGAHFALMRTKGMNALKRRNFEDRFGIRILGDDAEGGFPDIPAFLRQLQSESPTASAPPPRPLRRL